MGDATLRDQFPVWKSDMSISAISSSNLGPTQSFNPSSIRQAFSQLSSALQSGDLQGALGAYNTLAQSPAAQGNGPFAQALQQIGQDLQSGDVADAQKALAALQQQVHGHHHHHHGSQPAQAASNNSTQSSNTTNDGDANDATTTASGSPPAGSSSTNSVNITA